MLYIHRFLRLTPLLAISVLLSTTLIRFIGDGPIWPDLVEYVKNQCERHWWSMLLYVQNYVNPDDFVSLSNPYLHFLSRILPLKQYRVICILQCFVHSWYLSVDFQLFICAPFVVYLIYKFRTKAILCFTYLVVGCVGCTISTHLTNDFENNL